MKQNTKKRLLAVSLIGAMAMGTCSGCGKEEATTSKEVADTTTTTAAESKEVEEKVDVTFPLKENVTMSMLAGTNSEFPLLERRAWEFLEERSNVSWNVETAEGTNMVEVRGLQLSTNQYPDVMYLTGLTMSEVDKHAEQGTFIQLDELIAEYAPNLQKILDENPESVDSIRSEDGHIYSLPMIVAPDPQGQNFWIDQTWLERLGLEEPTNPDELYDVLKAFKEQDANGNGDPSDEIPFVTSKEFTMLQLLPYFGLRTYPTNWTSITDGVVSYAPASEEYKEMLAFLAKIYDEKILDKNCFIQTQAQVKAIQTEADIFGSLIAAAPFYSMTDPKVDNMKIMDPFEENMVFRGTGFTPGTFVITDKCEYPEIAMAWADYFYSDEGGTVTWIGIEGESFEVQEDGSYKDLIDIAQVKNYQLIGCGSPPSNRPEEKRMKTMRDTEVYFQLERDRITADYTSESYPVLHFSADQNKDIANINATVDPYVKEYLAKVVTGDLDLEESWDDYISQLKKMGLDEMMNIYQIVYDEKMSNQ